MKYLSQSLAGRILSVWRADAVGDELFLYEDRRLPVERYSDGLLDRSNTGRRRLAGWLDHLLLGLVDFLSAVRRYVHRAYFTRPDNPRIHGRCHVRSDHHRLFLALHLRRQCPPYGTKRHWRCRHGGRIGDRKIVKSAQCAVRCD